MNVIRDMLQSDDPTEVERANQYLQDQTKERQDSFVRWQSILQNGLSTEDPIAFDQYAGFLEENGVDVKRKRNGQPTSAEIKKFDKFRAAAIRQSKDHVEYYENMYDFLDMMQEGEQLSQTQTNALVKIANGLLEEGSLATEEYTKFIERYFIAKEMPEVRELAELTITGAVDFASVVEPRLRELGEGDPKLNKALRKEYRELINQTADFSGVVVEPQE